jgi:hypothetical protein
VYVRASQRLPRRWFGAAGLCVLMVLREPPSHGRPFKSTGSFDGFLFSIPGDAKGLGQVQGGVVQRQPMDGSPKIKRVALRTAIFLEASECVLAEMDRKRPLLIPSMAVHRTATAALRAATAQLIKYS